MRRPLPQKEKEGRGPSGSPEKTGRVAVETGKEKERRGKLPRLTMGGGGGKRSVDGIWRKREGGREEDCITYRRMGGSN